MNDRTSQLTGSSESGCTDTPIHLKVYASPTFVAALIVLLVNDIYLKTSYPGLLTGKLSDFAGVMLLALFLFPIFKKNIGVVATGVAVFFLWWKSPYSQPAIDYFNSFEVIRIGRVIDYSDLLALSMIPLSIGVFRTIETKSRNLSVFRKCLVAPSAALTILALMGTSTLTPRQEFVIQPSDPESSVTTDRLSSVVDSFFEKSGYTCDIVANSSRSCTRSHIWVSYRVDDDKLKFEVEGYPRGIGLFGDPVGRMRRDIDESIRELKIALSGEIEGLQYVEPLRDDLQYR